MIMVKTENLGRRYGTGNTRIDALSGVNLTVGKGEFLSIVGHSGSGKSTLLHLLGGVDRPTEGRILLDGEDMCRLPEKKLALFRRRKIGLIFQFYNLLPVLSAEENIVLPLLMDRRPVDKSHLDELIAVLGLTERRNHLPSELSGGQQQRVSIGRALIARPSLVLADEPTGNLDSRNGREIMDLLKLASRQFGQTLVLVTHDRELASEADRVVRVKDGRLAGEGRSL